MQERGWTPFLEFWVKMAKWPSGSKLRTPIFNTSWENDKMHICRKFGDSNSNPLQVIVWTSQNCQNSLNVKVKDLHFRHQLVLAGSIPWCMFGANLLIPAQICDDLSCGQGKIYGRTVRQTERQTQATTIPLHLKEQWVKWNRRESSTREQIFIGTNAGSLLIGSLGENFEWNLTQNCTMFINENWFENVVCEMSVIFSRARCGE